MEKRNDFFDSSEPTLVEMLIATNDGRVEECGDEEFPNCNGFTETEDSTLSYLDYVEPLYDPKKVIVENSILESTAEQIKQAMLRKLKNVIIVSGMESSGRKTAVQYLAKLLQESNLPDALKEITCIKVEFPEEEPTLNEVYDQLNEILKHYYENGCRKMLVFLGNMNEVPISFKVEYFKLKEMLEDVPFRLLKFIMVMDENPIFDDDYDVDKYSEKDDVKELEFFKDTYLISHDYEMDYMQIIKNLQPEIENLEKFHNVKASDKILEKALLIKASKCSNCIISYYIALNTFDWLMSIAELDSKEGEIVNVKFKHLKRMFKKDFENFNQMTEESKRSVAYHEAGHALLILLDEDKYISLNGIKLLYDGESGSTGINYTIERLVANQIDRQYTIRILAMDYSARILERNNNMSSVTDLENAFCIAKDFVLKSGTTQVGSNYICSNDQFFLSEHKKQIIEDEIQRLIDEAIIYAETKLKEYKAFVEELVEKLMKEYVLSSKDVKKLWKKYKK